MSQQFTPNHSHSQKQPPVMAEFEIKYPNMHRTFTPQYNVVSGKLHLYFLQTFRGVSAIDVGLRGTVTFHSSFKSSNLSDSSISDLSFDTGSVPSSTPSNRHRESKIHDYDVFDTTSYLFTAEASESGFDFPRGNHLELLFNVGFPQDQKVLKGVPSSCEKFGHPTYFNSNEAKLRLSEDQKISNSKKSKQLKGKNNENIFEHIDGKIAGDTTTSVVKKSKSHFDAYVDVKYELYARVHHTELKNGMFCGPEIIEFVTPIKFQDAIGVYMKDTKDDYIHFQTQLFKGKAKSFVPSKSGKSKLAQMKKDLEKQTTKNSTKASKEDNHHEQVVEIIDFYGNPSFSEGSLSRSVSGSSPYRSNFASHISPPMDVQKRLSPLDSLNTYSSEILSGAPRSPIPLTSPTRYTFGDGSTSRVGSPIRTPSAIARDKGAVFNTARTSTHSSLGSQSNLRGSTSTQLSFISSKGNFKVSNSTHSSNLGPKSSSSTQSSRSNSFMSSVGTDISTVSSVRDLSIIDSINEVSTAQLTRSETSITTTSSCASISSFDKLVSEIAPLVEVTKSQKVWKKSNIFKDVRLRVLCEIPKVVNLSRGFEQIKVAFEVPYITNLEDFKWGGQSTKLGLFEVENVEVTIHQNLKLMSPDHHKKRKHGGKSKDEYEEGDVHSLDDEATKDYFTEKTIDKILYKTDLKLEKTPYLVDVANFKYDATRETYYHSTNLSSLIGVQRCLEIWNFINNDTIVGNVQARGLVQVSNSLLIRIKVGNVQDKDHQSHWFDFCRNVVVVAHESEKQENVNNKQWFLGKVTPEYQSRGLSDEVQVGSGAFSFDSWSTN
ncbi:unnamed protein product [Ambrosiozyma monospora]|uniref:Unnamed protein product n=1 Tax=Ambrosiozyma monospora TaxID=43982 RepID=A0A9W6Z3V1_AMBMO|nr:unnamed protein product [Ambrosiozyma monospora]